MKTKKKKTTKLSYKNHPLRQQTRNITTFEDRKTKISQGCVADTPSFTLYRQKEFDHSFIL